jgi:hypothetical protein
MREYLSTIFFLFLWISFSHVFAQDIEDYVSYYKGENGQGYMQPMGDAFGAVLNSGINQSVSIPRVGFRFKVGVHFMTAFISDAQRMYSAKTEEPFLPQQTAQAPTILGSSEGAEVDGIAGTVFIFPGGLDVKRLPLAVPQASIGSILGTEAVVRYIQLDLDDNFKELKLLGYGFRHSLSQYLPLFPINVAASFFKQNFKVGDVVESDVLYFGLQASKSAALISLYGGVGFGKSNMKIEYDYESDVEREVIRFDLKSGTKFRTNIGVELNLVAIRLYADYNLGAQNILAFGVNVGY